MRNLDRIDTILNELSVLWKKYPDMRLMQLLHNVTGDSPFVYYIEDDQLITSLKEFYNDGGANEGNS